MYELRPIITFDAPIEFPTCMYRQKSIHDGDQENGPVGQSPQACTKILGTFKQVEQFIKNIESKEMAELEKRQEKLLSQLEDLKKIMESIKSNLKFSKNSSITCTMIKTSIISSRVKENISDIVINANPLYPPYFLLFLQRLLKNEVNFNVNCYLHSSISNFSGIDEAFVSNLKKIQVNGVSSVNIRLIWKNIGPHAELNVSQYPIKGEANILRYLVRTLDGELNYEKKLNPEEIDNLLDMSYKLSYSNSKSSRNSCLQYLNKSLSNAKWLGGKNYMTIADIAMFNSFKKIDSNIGMSSNLNKWFNQCEQYIQS